MAGKNKRRAAKSQDFRNVALVDALQTQDVAAVAFALRHGPTVVPILSAGDRDNPLDVGEVWTYRDPKSGDIALLLFSDAAHIPASLPQRVAVQEPSALLAFLRTHRDRLTTVFLDIAGPHPMQATPADLIAALEV